MAARKTVTTKLNVDSVPTEKSKIKFSVTFEGELDWNDDFVSEKNPAYSLLRSYHFSHQPKLNQAIIDYFWAEVRADDIGMFKTAKLTSCQVAKEVEDAYSKFHGEKGKEEKLRLQKELEEAEKRAAQIRNKLQSA